MKYKTQDVNSLEDLLKAANDFRKWAIDFGNELSKVLADIQASKKEEDTWEMKCPYDNGDVYYIITTSGLVNRYSWDNDSFENMDFKQGNIFPTEEAAELEAKRRNLLTRFKAFRDECNGDWKADWNKCDDKYYLYLANECKEIVTTSISLCEAFPLFGYFKNRKDLERAIELFGDEIKELFVE